MSSSRLAWLSLGTNLGDRRRYLRDGLGALPGLRRWSHVYETEPVGGPEQGAFLNLVAEIETALTPDELLEECHRLEEAAGRVRVERWGPRTLDVDIIAIDGETHDSPTLTIPHPRYRTRRFVLAPLAELAPHLCPPGWETEGADEVIDVGLLELP